MILQVILI